MLHFSSVSGSDRMLETGTIGARAITTRWNIFMSRRRSGCRVCSHCFAGPKSKVWKWTFLFEVDDFKLVGECDASQIAIVCSPFRKNFDLCLTIREQDKNKKRTLQIRFYFWKKIRLRTCFLLFFLNNNSNSWQPRELALHFELSCAKL